MLLRDINIYDDVIFEEDKGMVKYKMQDSGYQWRTSKEVE